jgi:2-iminobutanoate/2-iminopropanoate deaminase
MAKTDRRRFMGKGAAAAAVAAMATTPLAGQTQAAKKIWGKPSLFSPAVSYGNLLFLSGVGYHKPGDIKVHTKGVLDEIQQRLEAAGSSMEKVLKVQVYLADLKDYDAMNEVFRGRFGSEPPARTTVAVAGLPGNSLVEMDVIAYI